MYTGVCASQGYLLFFRYDDDMLLRLVLGSAIIAVVLFLLFHLFVVPKPGECVERTLRLCA